MNSTQHPRGLPGGGNSSADAGATSSACRSGGLAEALKYQRLCPLQGTAWSLLRCHSDTDISKLGQMWYCQKGLWEEVIKHLHIPHSHSWGQSDFDASSNAELLGFR